MALTRSFVRNAAMTPLDARLMNMATLVCNADGSPRTGVLGGANASIVSALATWHFRVQAAEFATSKGKADGVALPTNDGVVDVPIAAGAPASNSRIDVLWVKHEDNTTGDAASLPIFGVTSGAAGAAPVKPAIPTGAEELATLRAYSGTTGASGGSNVLTNTYQMTVSRGGIVPFRNAVELGNWATPPNGQRVILLDNGREFRRFSGAWAASDTGDVAITAGAGWTQTQAATHRVVGGMVTMNGRLDAAAPATTSAFTLPVGARPSQTLVVPVMRGTVFETAIIGTNGVVQFPNLSLPQSDYRLASIPAFPAA